jgi:hypothetical protein
VDDPTHQLGCGIQRQLPQSGDVGVGRHSAVLLEAHLDRSQTELRIRRSPVGTSRRKQLLQYAHGIAGLSRVTDRCRDGDDVCGPGQIPPDLGERVEDLGAGEITAV